VWLAKDSALPWLLKMVVLTVTVGRLDVLNYPFNADFVWRFLAIGSG